MVVLFWFYFGFFLSYDPKGKYLALDATRFPMDHRFWMMDFGDYGSNFRMTDMQAAVGREQLKKLARFNARRRAIAHRLHSELSSVRSLRLPELDSDVIVHSWHVFHILLTAEFPLSKEEFMWSMLKDFGVKVWNHYAPMHLASCFRLRQIGKRGDCPNAEVSLNERIVFPSFCLCRPCLSSMFLCRFTLVCRMKRSPT